LPEQKFIPAELEKHLVNLGFSTIAIIGCRSTGRSLPCCEHDVLVDAKEKAILHDVIGSKYIDLIPIPQKSTAEQAFDLLPMKIIMDPSMILSGLQGGSRKEDVIKDYTLSKILEAISASKKAEDAHQDTNRIDASFWIHSAALELSASIIALSRGTVHPTHLLDDVRDSSSALGISYEIIAEAMNLHRASRTSVERRLAGINEVMLSSLQIQEGSPESVYIYSKQLNEKVSWLLKNHAILQASAFLGYESVRMLKRVYYRFCQDKGIPPHHSRVITEILGRGDAPYRLSHESFKLLAIENEAGTLSTLQGLVTLVEVIRKKATTERLN
jgi:hypothetical protein